MQGAPLNEVYHEHGKKHPDTFECNDGLFLNPHSQLKITAIKAWESTFVQGLEFFYNGLSYGPRIGIAQHHGRKCHEFHLQPNEELTEVSGRAGDIMDHITFHTNLNRTFAVGSSGGGNPFHLKVHNHVIRKFKFGIGGHLHNIGAFFVPTFNFIPINLNIVQPTMKVGGVNPDTKPFDDLTSFLTPMIQTNHMVNVEKIIVHSANNVFGVDIDYRVTDMNGAHQEMKMSHHGHEQKHSGHQHVLHLKPGEFITEIHGRGGAILDALYFKTNLDQNVGGGGNGGNPFSVIIPPGRRVFAFGGGTNGHLHNLYAYHV